MSMSGGHLEIVNLMIAKGANNWDGDLGAACRGGHLEIVKLMIEKGAQNWNRGLYKLVWAVTWKLSN